MLKTVVVAAALVAALATSAPAAVVGWTAKLDQAQEVLQPPLGAVPDAEGMGKGTLDTLTGMLTWTITYQNLSGPAVGLHFHAPGAPGVNAPVVVNVGTISGLLSPTSGSATLSTDDVTDFLAGLFYINVHTALNPSGEIRGQVAPVPLPAAAGLMLAGVLSLAGLGVARKRRAGAV